DQRCERGLPCGRACRTVWRSQELTPHRADRTPSCLDLMAGGLLVGCERRLDQVGQREACPPLPREAPYPGAPATAAVGRRSRPRLPLPTGPAGRVPPRAVLESPRRR